MHYPTVPIMANNYNFSTDWTTRQTTDFNFVLFHWSPPLIIPLHDSCVFQVFCGLKSRVHALEPWDLSFIPVVTQILIP